MCGIDRYQFEKNKINFKKHFRNEHNIWDYVYFIIYIKNKPLKDCNGIKYYLKRTYEKGGLEWSPKGCALSLGIHERERNEDRLAKLEKMFGELQKNHEKEKNEDVLGRIDEMFGKFEKNIEERFEAMKQI